MFFPDKFGEIMIVRWISKRRNKAAAALAAAVVMSCLVNTGATNTAPEKRIVREAKSSVTERGEGEQLVSVGREQDFTPVYAWWGTLYPKFSFSERKKGKVKISFWLAKAFKWC